MSYVVLVLVVPHGILIQSVMAISAFFLIIKLPIEINLMEWKDEQENTSVNEFVSANGTCGLWGVWEYGECGEIEFFHFMKSKTHWPFRRCDSLIVIASAGTAETQQKQLPAGLHGASNRISWLIHSNFKSTDTSHTHPPRIRNVFTHSCSIFYRFHCTTHSALIENKGQFDWIEGTIMAANA